MSETITFHNPTDKPVNCRSLLGADAPFVGPGEDVEIPLELCAPKRLDNGSRGKSPIEKNCPQLTPKDPAFGQEWRKTPAPAPVTSRIAAVTKREPSVPAGVLAAREAKAAAQAAKAPQAAPEAPLAPVAPKPATAKPAAAKPATAKPAQAPASTPAKPAAEPAPPAAEPEAEAKA